MRRLFRVAAVSIILLLWGILPGVAVADGPISVLSMGHESVFNEKILFSIEAESSAADIVEARVYYRVKGQSATGRNYGEFEPSGKIETSWEWDVRQDYLPPGSEVEYWWKLKDGNDNELETEPETFMYIDERYDWKSLQNERLSLYWYNGDEEFARKIFEEANDGLDLIQEKYGVSIEDPVKIFIYGSHPDLLGALQEGSREWTGGVAFTEFGVVVIGVEPTNAGLSWGLGATRHELTHLVIHRATENVFRGDLPRWLDEGLAVYNEGSGQEDYKYMVKLAVEHDSLLSLQTLSSNFTADSELAHLSYAQSYSVVSFILDEYGTEKMQKLLEVFAEGALYDEAFEEVYGMDMAGIENAWRASVGAKPLSADEGKAVEPPSPPELPGAVPVVPSPASPSATCCGIPLGFGALFVLFFLLRPPGSGD